MATFAAHPPLCPAEISPYDLNRTRESMDPGAGRRNADGRRCSARTQGRSARV